MLSSSGLESSRAISRAFYSNISPEPLQRPVHAAVENALMHRAGQGAQCVHLTLCGSPGPKGFSQHTSVSAWHVSIWGSRCSGQSALPSAKAEEHQLS